VFSFQRALGELALGALGALGGALGRVCLFLKETIKTVRWAQTSRAIYFLK
jgi:hypothetical protein